MLLLFLLEIGFGLDTSDVESQGITAEKDGAATSSETETSSEGQTVLSSDQAQSQSDPENSASNKKSDGAALGYTDGDPYDFKRFCGLLQHE